MAFVPKLICDLLQCTISIVAEVLLRNFLRNKAPSFLRTEVAYITTFFKMRKNEPAHGKLVG